MKISELSAVIMLAIGLLSVVAGAWLIWDLINTIVNLWVKEEFWIKFYFYFPFFISTARTWTLPFDIGLTLLGIGVTLAVIGAYLIGYLKE